MIDFPLVMTEDGYDCGPLTLSEFLANNAPHPDLDFPDGHAEYVEAVKALQPGQSAVLRAGIGGGWVTWIVTRPEVTP